MITIFTTTNNQQEQVKMKNSIQTIKRIQASFSHVMAYLPRKVSVAILLLLTSPALSLADGEDLNSMTEKWQGYFGTIKKFFGQDWH